MVVAAVVVIGRANCNGCGGASGHYRGRGRKSRSLGRVAEAVVEIVTIITLAMVKVVVVKTIIAVAPAVAVVVAVVVRRLADGLGAWYIIDMHVFLEKPQAGVFEHCSGQQCDQQQFKTYTKDSKE